MATGRTTTPDQVKPRRIVVALDAHRRARASLDTAAGMAARLHAELIGLVIEDIQLLHFAALPFAREVGLVPACSRELDVTTMERSLRSMARDAERWLSDAAARAPMQWSLRVRRGGRIEELMAAADDADLIVTDGTVLLLYDDTPEAEHWEREARAMLHRPRGGAPVHILRVANRVELERLLRGLP